MKIPDSDRYWRIRQAVDADYPAIYDLQLRAYRTEDLLYSYTIPPMLQSKEEAIADCRKSSLVLVALIDDAIIGSVRGSINQHICLINKLMVDPHWRCRGIGTSLLQEMEARLPAEKFQLFTGTNSQNNIRLYQKNGYEIVHKDQGKELVYMEKEVLTEEV